MAVFKCKMCGAALEINEGSTITICEYCGSQQTLPRLNDDKLERLYDRANHFRRNNEFDKAMGIYEQILDENNEDAESYWSLVLCKYGIEYVEDPVSHKRIPTINRTQFTSVFDDDNYKSALKYADISQKAIYEQEATTINEIQKGILDISQKEEPFDVFICYKETDECGQRTHDSVYANELYHELTEEGFKVFFARITLEDKLGVAYEPYIFAALNSAKVMVVIGTKAEYFNAVWVKNEWSRFLSLIKNGEKKVLIPAYRDMDPYNLPKEFSHLQAQDMNKLGFMPDLVRGIKKLVGTQPKLSPPDFSTSQAAEINQTYNVRLLSDGGKTLNCVKLIHDTFGLGLKESKDLAAKNSIIAKNISIYEAESIQNTFLRNGFTVSIEEVGRNVPLRNNYISNSADTETLLRRVTLFLESRDWNSADVYCEKVLDIDPENAKAYICKLLAQLHVTKEEDLKFSNTPLESMMPYKNALRFADEYTAKRLIEYNRVIKENIAKREQERQEHARIEQERKQQEEKKRREIRSLQEAKYNTEKLISSQIKEKESLQIAIALAQSEKVQKTDYAKKIRKFAITVLFLAAFTFFFFIFFILIEVNAIQGEESAAGVLLSIGVLLYIIFCVCLLKADGKSAALVILNLFTYGIFNIVFAIIALNKSKKNKISTEYIRKISVLEPKLQRVEEQIDNTRASLREINQKLEAINKN